MQLGRGFWLPAQGHRVIPVSGSPKETRSPDVGPQRLRQQHSGPARAGAVVPGEPGFAVGGYTFRGGRGQGRPQSLPAGVTVMGNILVTLLASYNTKVYRRFKTRFL